MTETTARIRWQDDRLRGFTGSVGTLKPWVFHVWRSPHDRGEWVLTARLPGTRRHFGGDPDELKAEAEHWLEEFTSSLGAIFPDAGNWHDGWTFASRDGDGNLILRYEPSGGLYKILPVEEC